MPDPGQTDLGLPSEQFSDSASDPAAPQGGAGRTPAERRARLAGHANGLLRDEVTHGHDRHHVPSMVSQPHGEAFGLADSDVSYDRESTSLPSTYVRMTVVLGSPPTGDQ